jgi:hypothetical protein
MLNPRLTIFQDGEAVRQLHAKYGSLESSLLPLLWQLFLENRNPLEDSRLFPSLRALFLDDQEPKGEAHYPQWLPMLFPAEEVRLPLAAFRNGAVFYYIEAAAVRVDARGELPDIRRRLQSLGGKLARLKGLAGQEAEQKAEQELQQKAITAQMEDLRFELKHLPHCPNLDRPQLWWHWAMVWAYENLPRIGRRKQVSPSQVARLCQWLSVPEIGLQCTPATIKAARRRFVSRDWFGHQYPTYISTPRGAKRSSPMEPETAKDVASDQAMESIQFTCHICRVSMMDTLRGLGLHLQEKHEIWIDDTEISEEGMLIREKETQAVLATWQELTPKRTTNESLVTDQ